MENNGQFFEVKITPKNKIKHEIQEDPTAVLVLAPFNKAPNLQFENVKLGTSKVLELIVRNPNDNKIQVQLDKLPTENHGLKFSNTLFVIEPCQQEVLHIEWTPDSAGSWRHVVQVKGNLRLKLDIVITCSCVDPQKGKKNGKPLRYKNSNTNATLVAKKTGVKTCLQGRNESFHGEKKKSPLRFTKKSSSTGISIKNGSKETLKPKSDNRFNASTEKFVTIKDNKLPPCALPPTPHRRKTYVVSTAKEDNKENNYVLLEQTNYVSETTDTTHSSEMRTPHPKNNPSFHSEKMLPYSKFKTFDSHPRNTTSLIERSKLSRKAKKSSPPERNFKDMLDSICLTPTTSFNFGFTSPEDNRLPPFTVSATPDLPPCIVSPTSERRKTFAVSSPSKTGSESIQCTERHFTKKVRVVHSSTRSSKISANTDTFNDSLEDDVFVTEIVTKSSNKTWFEWQNHNEMSSVSSASSNDRELNATVSTPREITKISGLTPFLDKLHFSNDSETPISFSLPPSREDMRRCSTIMKNLDNVGFSPTAPDICKDLFPVDTIDDTLPLDNFGNLSSETFIKSESSFPDLNVHFSDISYQDFQSKSNCQSQTYIDSSSITADDDSAKSIIEAGLWFEPSKEKLTSKSTCTNFVHNLETIGEESICSLVGNEMTSILKCKEIADNSRMQSEKLSRNGNMFLEISPPNKQMCVFKSEVDDDDDDDSTRRKNASRIKGWSKSSVRRQKPFSLACTAYTSRETSSDNLTGKKRQTDSQQLSEFTAKRRALNKGVGINKSSHVSIPRTAVSKLSLSSKKVVKEDSVKLHSPDEVLSSLANPNLFTTTNVEPFITSSVYYDEEWMQQQEKEFTKWLNSILTPPAELDSSTALPKVDVAELWTQSCRKQEIELAPTRETVSSQYHVQHRLDALRKAACSLFRSEEIAKVLSKVAVHIDKKLISIRSDRDLHLDFGLKCKVMSLLLSYNPLWLRIGLESIYGQTIALESNSDVRGLTKFIMTRLLSDPFIVTQYTHPTVTHLYVPGFEEAMKKFTLKKFLLLVYFLDKAKEKRLISHDPCLFCKDAEIKNSREILLSFSRDLLSGVGDITKHLKSLGYLVSQKQTYLDEFEYAVSCLGVELRDGIRLTRVMEIILQNRSLSQELRVPAVSRLQKIHNVTVALTALKNAGYVLTGDITAKDISDGHREKTLSLLWQIIYKFQIPRFGSAALKIQKWWHNQSLKLEINKRIKAKHLAKLNEAATNIQCSWRRYVARKKLKILKEEAKINLIVRQKAATIIQKNWRMYIQCKHYKHALNSIKKIQYWYRNAKITKWERAQYCRKRQVLVNFQAQCRGYLYRKRLDGLKRTAAALKIQTWFRRHRAKQMIETLIPFIKKHIEEKRIAAAALVIQRKFRATMEMKQHREKFLLLKAAAISIQNRLRATMLMKHDRQLYLKQKSAAIIIQRQWRATLEMRKQMSIYRLEKFAIITIQQKFRAVNEMKYRRRVFIQMKSAALKIQQWFRATLKMRNQRKDYLVRRSAALIIQRKYRAMKIMQIQRNLFLRQKSAAIIIQRKHRAKLLMQEHRKNYCLLRSTVITIQNRYRGKKLMLMERRNFLQLKHAAVFIQRKYRATLLMRNQMSSHQQLRSAAIIIQNKFRANKRMQLERQHFINKRMAAGIIQTRFRAQMMMLSQRNLFQKQKNAAITIQRKFRAMMLMQEQKKNYCLLRSAVIAIQIKYRAKKLMLTERQNFLQLKHAAVLIQRKFKATLFMRNQMSSYQQLRSAAIVIQNKFKANKMMREIRQKYLLQKSAALTLQSAFRAKKCMEVQRKQFLTQKLAAMVIQRWFRALLMMKDQRKIYMLQKSAAIVIQRNFRLHMSKMSKHRQALRKKQEILRKEATAAAKIQAVWRGYRVRKTGTQAMIAVRERALSISRNAFPGLTLQTRSIAALRTLEKTCSGRLIWALMELDTITQLSPKLCIDIANIGVVMKIFEYIKNANRSEVDKEMCLVATKVLINLARFSKTIDKVWEVHGNVSTITNLMFTWCGKNEALFCNCCTLLWLFVLDAERAKQMLKVKQLQERLIYCQRQLKQKQDKTVMKPASSKGKPRTKFTLPSTEPDWGLTGASLQRTFVDSFHAVNCVIKKLNL